MKLNIVPARTGLLWVKLGIKTFFGQPLAMSGLFFMFMAVLSLATLVISSVPRWRWPCCPPPRWA